MNHWLNMTEENLPKIKTNISYTFCESGENHVGNQQIGHIVKKGEGFNLDDFTYAIKKWKFAWECESKIEIKFLNGLLPENAIVNTKGEVVSAPNAYVLVLRNGVNEILKKVGKTQEDLYREVASNKWDTKYWDIRRKRVLNKHARSNNVVSDFAQEANYKEGQGTVINFDKCPLLSAIRQGIYELFGEKAKGMIAEGNKYDDGGEKKHGIGWHGDIERRRVICVRCGAKESMPMHFRWYYDCKPVGDEIVIPLNGGDIYMMSEYAVGTNWRHRSKLTLRHATGAPKYLK